jgi:hypothetical protein
MPLLLATSCAAGDAEFNITRAPGFVGGPGSVSVFGVFKSGRMSPEYWDRIGSVISNAFGHDKCEAVYGERLQNEDSQLFSKIDDDTKENGITDGLLAQMATRAVGGYILSMSAYGELRDESHAKSALQRSAQSSGGSPRAMRNRGGMGAHQARSEAVDQTGLQMSVTLFSIEARGFVAKVEMRYTGSSIDDAAAKLADRVRVVMPNLTCAGWRWK